MFIQLLCPAGGYFDYILIIVNNLNQTRIYDLFLNVCMLMLVTSVW